MTEAERVALIKRLRQICIDSPVINRRIADICAAANALAEGDESVLDRLQKKRAADHPEAKGGH